MVSYNVERLEGSRTPAGESSTRKDGTSTSNGTPAPGFGPRHPSSVLWDKLPPPGQTLDGNSTIGTSLSATQASTRNSCGSLPSTTNISFMDDMKHEVMVNYLFQQQCGKLWIGDASGEVEGIILRKSRGNYTSCPPNLVQSSFAYCCSQINLQVSPKALNQIMQLINASVP